MKLKRLRRKGNAYYFDTQAKPRRWIALGSDLTVAMRRYEALIRHAPAEGTVGEIVAEYLLSIKGKVRDSTLVVYRQYQRHLSAVFGEMPAEHLMPRDVARYVDTCKRASRDNEISLLRAAYAHALRTRDLPPNPCAGIRSERGPAKEKRYISDAELAAIIGAAPPLLAVAIELAYATGLRVSDILKLRWDDFAPDGAVIQKKVAGTGSRQRYVLTPELGDLLDRATQLQGNVRSVYVIAGRGGQPIKYATLWTWWRAACAAAGVDGARIHDIRAKAATDADAAGADATKLLGHASPQVTKGYLRGLKINVVEPLKRRKM